MGKAGWRRLIGWFGRVTGQAGDNRWEVYRRARRDPPEPGPDRERLISQLIFERQRHKEHRDVAAYDRLIRELRLGAKGTEKREE